MAFAIPAKLALGAVYVDTEVRVANIVYTACSLGAGGFQAP